MFKFDIPQQSEYIKPANDIQIQAGYAYEAGYLERKLEEIIQKALILRAKFKDDKMPYIIAHLNDHLRAADMPEISQDELLELVDQVAEIDRQIISDLKGKYENTRHLWQQVDRIQAFLYQRMGFLIGESDILPNVSTEIDFSKSGSQLRIEIPASGDLLEYRFINTLPTSSMLIWKYMHELGLPVARILAWEDKGDLTEVTSCFEGVDLSQIPNYFLLAMPELTQMIWGQRDRVLDELKAQAVIHGHPHEGNFTVLFYSRSELAQLQIDNINHIVPGSVTCTYDLIEVMMNPSEWYPIVRLIDWDAARFRTPDDHEG